jgi:hypothetical protein
MKPSHEKIETKQEIEAKCILSPQGPKESAAPKEKTTRL